MALIKCPECGQIISSSAYSCPHCGYVVSNNKASFNNENKDDSIGKEYRIDPNDYYPNSNKEEEKITAEAEEINSSNSNDSYQEGSYLIGFVLVFFLHIIGLIIALVLKQPKTTKGALITFLIYVGVYVVSAIVMAILIPYFSMNL